MSEIHVGPQGSGALYHQALQRSNDDVNGHHPPDPLPLRNWLTRFTPVSNIHNPSKYLSTFRMSKRDIAWMRPIDRTCFGICVLQPTYLCLVKKSFCDTERILATRMLDLCECAHSQVRTTPYVGSLITATLSQLREASLCFFRKS